MSLIPLKVWLGVAALAALGLLLWHDHHMSRLFKAERQKTGELARTLDTERHNAQLARESSDAYQLQLETLRNDRAATPARVVRLCHPAGPVLPGAAGGSAAPGEEAVPDPARPDIEAGPDIGQQLYTLADEADECAVQRDALIDWIRRTTPVQ